jgi:type II secretory pathway pseudopilin PulG
MKMKSQKARSVFRAGRRRGFTLVEALASIAFVAVVLPVALEGIRLASRTGRLANARLQAAQLAETKLGELAVTGDWLYGDLSDTFGDDWPDFRWELTVENWAEDPEADTLQMLTLTVFFTVQGREYDVALSTLSDEAAASAAGSGPGLSSSTSTGGAR